MKTSIIIAFLATIAMVHSYPADSEDEPIAILQEDSKIESDGSFHYSYETANGIQAEQHADVKHASDGTDFLVVEGRNSYDTPEGDHIELTYTADENGYHPRGNAIPTPPPIPADVLKGIQLSIAAEEERQANDSSN